jgi:hypothetical protein
LYRLSNPTVVEVMAKGDTASCAGARSARLNRNPTAIEIKVRDSGVRMVSFQSVSWKA